MAFWVPYDVCGVCGVVSSTTSGSGPPKLAIELVKTSRGGRGRARHASRTARVPCRLMRMPRSKSASAAALTTAAKWKTLVVRASMTWVSVAWSVISPVATCRRASVVMAGSGVTVSSTTTVSRDSSSPLGPTSLPRCNRVWARRRPKNPAPPVMTIFITLPLVVTFCAQAGQVSTHPAKLGTAYRNWPRQYGGATSRAQHRCAALAPRNVRHVRQFRHDQLVHCQPYGRTRTRHGDDHRATRHTSCGPTHHGRRTDLRIAQVAKQLTKARQFFLKTALHHLIGAITRGQPRATTQQDGVRVLCLHEVREQTPDLLRLILDDGVGADGMTRLGERLLHVLTTGVVLRRARVTHGDDDTAHTAGSLLPVLLVTHDACPSAKAGKGPSRCTSLSSGRAESKSRTRTPEGNWTSGANSASGTRTKRRSCSAAWGIVRE